MKTEDNTQDLIDEGYVQGNRAATISHLVGCFQQLGCDSEEMTRFLYLKEREQAIAVLRRICTYHGDNDWDESLHLADIIDKHLGSYLQEKE